MIMNDLEQLMFSYYVIYFEKIRINHTSNRERSFKEFSSQLHGSFAIESNVIELQTITQQSQRLICTIVHCVTLLIQ